MMKKVLMMSAVCAAVLAVTGCNEDTEYKADPAQQEQIDKLMVENEALAKSNASLEADNAKLTEQTSSFISNFNEQCASIGVEFDYVAPEDDYRGSSISSFAAAAEEQSCNDCHSVGNDLGAPVPHNEDVACDSCHDDPHVESGPIEGNPTDPTFEQPAFAPGAVDGETGASGPTYYTSGSYLNADFLVEQGNKSVTRYEWSTPGEDDASFTTLAQACQAVGREHVSDMFPNDGNAYALTSKSNSLAAKSVATVSMYDDQFNKIDTPYANVAVFGFAIKKEADGSGYFTDMFINKNNTCHNAIMNGEARLEWYEYDPTQSVKVDLTQPARNRGARIIVETDYERTQLKDFYWSGDIVGGDSGVAVTPENYQANFDQIGSCKLYFKVKSIIPLG